MNSPRFPAQLLPDRAVLRVGGEGALAFLHNLLTMDLNTPRPAYGALLTPQGKILHDVFVVPDGDAVWVDVARNQAPELLKRLIMYRLRAKLDIGLQPEKHVAASSDNDLPGRSYADPRLPAMGYRAIGDAGPVADGYHAARIANGLADSTADLGSGEYFVHEANLDQLNGVSFSKGCYVGQEVVSRTHHRHTARSRILPVRLNGAVSQGTAITSGEKRIGEVLSSHNNEALALIRFDRLAEATAPLLAGHVSIHVRKPAWATFDLTIPDIAR